MTEFTVRDEGDATDWTQPGVFRVADNVYRIPLPLPNDGLKAVNVYAIVDDGGLTMIDSGWALAESEERLGHAIAALGFGFGDIRQFLVTHVHRDHYTQAVTIRRKYGNEVSLGIGEQESLRAAGTPRPMRSLDGLRSFGADPLIALFQKMDRPEPEPADLWEAPDEWIDGRTDIKLVSRSLLAIPTPGHTAGHLVFRDDANVLTFTGDHVLPHITPSIGFEAKPVKFPLADYLDSLKLVRGMPDTTMLPAHGPARESVHARVDELLEHHDHRLELSRQAIEKGATTAYEAAGLISWTRREKKLVDLDPFNQMLATFETSAHLNVLVLQGRLSSAKTDGVWRYSLS